MVTPCRYSQFGQVRALRRGFLIVICPLSRWISWAYLRISQTFLQNKGYYAGDWRSTAPTFMTEEEAKLMTGRLRRSHPLDDCLGPGSIRHAEGTTRKRLKSLLVIQNPRANGCVNHGRPAYK